VDNEAVRRDRKIDLFKVFISQGFLRDEHLEEAELKEPLIHLHPNSLRRN
jgi:hypothetical protein